MANNVGNYKRIAKNTLMLYIRMLFVTLVSLYTFRLLLSALGQEDYGLYNVIGGVIVMMSFLTQTLSSASQRFYSYSIAQKNDNQLSTIYSSTIILYGGVVTCIVIIAETAGLWFLNTKMTIPPNRLVAANIVYQFTILSFCWKVFTAAHQALIIAFERMTAYAYVSIIEILFKLAIVFYLTKYQNDRLILYATLVFVTHFLTNGIYIIYSKRKFKNVKFLWPHSKKIMRDIISYSGWTLIGMLSVVVRSSGINLVLNVFFNPIVNAARGIAFTVNSVVNSLTGNFYMAVRPQIVKNYSKQDLDACYKLIFRSTKFSFSLALLSVLPLMLFAPEILDFWIEDYPEYTVIFVRLTLLTALIDSIANPLNTFNQATGKIRKYQLCVSTLIILNLPLCVAAFYMGANPIMAFVIPLVISLLANILRLYLNKSEHGFPASLYFKVVITRISLITLASVIIIPFKSLFHLYVHNIIQLIVYMFLVCVWVASCSFLLGFDRVERNLIWDTIKKYINR